MTPTPTRPPPLLLWILVGIGLLPVALGAWAAWTQHRRIARAVPLPAEVTESRIQEVPRKNASPARIAVVRYRWRDPAEGSRLHSGERLLPGPWGVSPPGDEAVARFPVGTPVTAWTAPGDPSDAFLLPIHSFVPYLVMLLGAPLFALAAGLATGGVRYLSSSRPEVEPPEARENGWFEVAPFRSQRDLRNAALAAAFVFGGMGVLAFVPYGLVVESFHGAAGLALVLWVFLVLRLLWGAAAKTWAAGRLEEAKLFVKPEIPVAGQAFAVRVVQTATNAVTIRRFDLRLYAERSELQKGGRRWKTRVVCREKARAGEPKYLIPGESHAAEHVFEVPAAATNAGGFLRWRVELRTRILGADYRTQFPFPTQ